MTIRHIAAAAAVAATLGFGVAEAQTGQPAQNSTPGAAAPESVPGGTGTGIPGATSAQPNPTPGLSPAQGTQAPSASNPGMPGANAQNQDRGMAPGGAATGTTTPGGSATTQGGGRSEGSTPPAATTRHTEPRTANAPVPGANSFTEGQARARMSDAGFNDVQDLRLDDQGIWRGRAMRGGQQTGVALDFQGNVVAVQ